MITLFHIFKCYGLIQLVINADERNTITLCISCELEHNVVTPNIEKLEGHIAFGLSVCTSITLF